MKETLKAGGVVTTEHGAAGAREKEGGHPGGALKEVGGEGGEAGGAKAGGAKAHEGGMAPRRINSTPRAWRRASARGCGRRLPARPPGTPRAARTASRSPVPEWDVRHHTWRALPATIGPSVRFSRSC